MDENDSSLKQGKTIVKPIVFGNIAKYFGKKREEDGHTHQWTVYVKPYLNEDMSVWIKKIHFKLHESYAVQNRIVSKPPYEISETGWGEFEVVIKIYFNDPGNEKPVTLYHILRLFHTKQDNPSGKNIVSESYEELIFHNPSSLMIQLLSSSRPYSLNDYNHETNFKEEKSKCLSSIISAKMKIQDEIKDLKEKLKLTKELVVTFRNEISQAQKEYIS